VRALKKSKPGRVSRPGKYLISLSAAAKRINFILLLSQLNTGHFGDHFAILLRCDALEKTRLRLAAASTYSHGAREGTVVASFFGCGWVFPENLLFLTVFFGCGWVLYGFSPKTARFSLIITYNFPFIHCFEAFIGVKSSTIEFFCYFPRVFLALSSTIEIFCYFPRVFLALSSTIEIFCYVPRVFLQSALPKVEESHQNADAHSNCVRVALRIKG